MATTSTLIVSLFVFSFGGWICLWLLYSLAQPFLRMWRGQGAGSYQPSPGASAGASSKAKPKKKGFTERWAFRRNVRALKELEKALEDKNISKAKKLIPTAVYMEWLKDSTDLVASGSHHNLEVLNKLILVAEQEGGSIKNLPKLEQLFGKRSDILVEAFETKASKKRFSAKQRAKGKSAPAWSTKEFDVRLTDLKESFEALKSEIQDELKLAISELHSKVSTDTDSNRYH